MKKVTLAVTLVVILIGTMSWKWMPHSMGNPIHSPEAGPPLVGSRRVLTPDFDSPYWQAAAKDFDIQKKPIAMIFAGATKVESFRIFQSGHEKPLGQIRDYKIYAKGKVLNRDFASQLGEVVLDPKSFYLPDHDGKMCDFQPAVVLRIWKGAGYADVLMCFHCKQLQIFSGHLTSSLKTSSLKGWILMGDFDTVEAKLFALCREALAHDKAFNSLKSAESAPDSLPHAVAT